CRGHGGGRGEPGRRHYRPPALEGRRRRPGRRRSRLGAQPHGGCSVERVSDPFVLEGDELVRVVGTSHYQDALLALAPREADEEVRAETIARLVREPDNPHDPNAIAVQIDGRLVGYFSRDENRRWLDVIGDDAIGCAAMIAGK